MLMIGATCDSNTEENHSTHNTSHEEHGDGSTSEDNIQVGSNSNTDESQHSHRSDHASELESSSFEESGSRTHTTDKSVEVFDDTCSNDSNGSYLLSKINEI